MKLSNKISVDGYMRKIRADFKKGIVLKSIIENSAEETIEQVKQANPELVKAAVDYIKYAERLVKQGYIPPQKGIVQGSTEERKALQVAFTLDTREKIKIFQPEWYITAYELFIYHLLEAVFDASLLIEQGAERKFRELVTLYRTYYRIPERDNCFFAYYDRSVLFIDSRRGRILRADNRVIRDTIAKSPIKEIKKEKQEYWLVLESGKKFLLMTNGKLSSGAWVNKRILKDHSKEYYQIHLKFRDVDSDTPVVQFPAHILLLLGVYGIEPIKHTILKDSLLVCDHVDVCPQHNEIENLELVFRRDNILRSRAKDPIVKKNVSSFNLGRFWEHINQSFNLDKIDIKMKREALSDYWEEVLKEKSVEEILAV